MDREPDGVDGAGGAGTRAPGTSGRRRLIAAGAAGGVVLLLVIAVLATRLASLPAPGSASTGSSSTGAASPSGAASASPSAAATLTVPGIYQQIEPSVVTVRTAHDLGTGLVVDDNGTILTADHVVAGQGNITVKFADGTVTSATIASADKTTDIAMLTPAALPKVVVPAELGGGVDVGDEVVAVGNPLGLTDSVSSGVVSGLNRSAQTDTGKRTGLIQFDASINPGSSGGPLLDDRGMVVGIVVALADPDGKDAFAGIGFAVPIGTALSSGDNGKNQGNNGPQI